MKGNERAKRNMEKENVLWWVIEEKLKLALVNGVIERSNECWAV